MRDERFPPRRGRARLRPAGRRDIPLAAGHVLAMLLVATLCAGCASRVVYRARTLPVEYQPRPTRDIRDIVLPQLAAQQDASDVIMPGDLLEVTVLTDLDNEKAPISCRVNDQGNIQVPPIGQVAVGGLRFPEAEIAIARAAIERDVYRRPTVTVKRVATRTYRITVTGAVGEPGVYDIPAAQADLLTALLRAGGLKSDAEPVAEIRRLQRGPRAFPADEKTAEDGQIELTSFSKTPEAMAAIKVDLLSASEPSQSIAEYRLQDGDVVFVPQRKLNPIYVDGLVNKPGMYPFPATQELRLLDALALAGGRSNPLAEKVWIVRQIPGRSEPILIKANLRAAAKNPSENLRIAPGDMITVEETFGTFVYNLLKGFVHVGGTVPLY